MLGGEGGEGEEMRGEGGREGRGGEGSYIIIIMNCQINLLEACWVLDLKCGVQKGVEM